MLTGSRASAHNGANAIAAPAGVITVDGDLGDWPSTTSWLPIEVVGYGESPKSPADLSAMFAAAHDATDRVLYVAVRVTDESVAVDTSASAHEQKWNGQDGCEIYLDVLHRRDQSPGILHALYGDTQANLLSSGGVFPDSWDETVVRVQRRDGQQTYEWRIPLDTDRVDPGVARSIGLDIAICDRDDDGSFTWLSWGRGAVKIRSAHRRGDLVLTESTAVAGRLDISLVRETSGDPEPHQVVRLQSRSSDELWLVGETDERGHFTATLPVGEYQVALQGSTVVYPVIITGGGQMALSLVYPRPQGDSLPAACWQQAPAGSGMRSERWHQLGMADGLSGSDVRSMYQDSRGYIWFGTVGGICRYDGRVFMALDTGDEVHAVMGIAEDRRGHLWFGFYGGGVVRFDGTDLTRFTTQHGLADNQVSDLLTDRRGDVWISTMGGGVSRFDGSYFNNYTARDGLASNAVWAMAEEKDGDIWFGTLDGGASRFDGESFKTFTTADGLAHNRIQAVHVDRDTNVWFATAGAGVSRYDGETFVTLNKTSGLAGDDVQSVQEDSEGTLWFGTETGLSRYNGVGFDDAAKNDGLADGVIRSLLVDREQNLWVGTGGRGVARSYGRPFETMALPEPFEGANVVVPEDGDRLLFGGEGGLLRYDRKRAHFEKLSDEPVMSGFRSRDGDIWIGTHTSVLRYADGHLNEVDALSAYSRRQIAAAGQSFAKAIGEDGAGNLWIGTPSGLLRFDGEDLELFTTEQGLANNSVTAIAQGHSGDMWFGTAAGLSHFDGADFTNTTTGGLAGKRVTALEVDDEGIVWIGTVDGLSSFSGDGFTTYGKGGLPNGSVISIMADGPLLWLGTLGGVSRFDGDLFQSMTQADGLHGSAVYDMHRDDDGDLWFVDPHGITRFRQQAAPPLVHLTNVIGDKPHGPVGEVSLSAATDYLAFEFVGLSYKTRAESMVYRYRLRGFENEWQNTHVARVEYIDLPIGDYTFEVIAVDRDLDVSAVAATVQVHIRPPYERIAWVVGLGLSGLFIAWQTRHIVRGNRQLRSANQLLQTRTEDLEQANAEALEATQAKSVFLANMSHELRTPLHSIIDFTSLIRDDMYGEISPKLRDAVGEIDQNSDRLLQLVNDVLEIARGEGDTIELQLSACTAEACIDVAAASLEYRAAAKDLELVREVAADLPPLWADERRLTEQVLVNLLKNAINYTEVGRVTISAQHEGDDVLFRVTDTGVGIAPQELSRVFDTFYQIDSSLTRKTQGTGLGLAIARQFVEGHKGRIWAESEVGKGSAFCVAIPIVRPS
ncbi:MAG: hypothetical protein HN404_12575 [Gemmatimonadetes bacterium]|nr:hypothetical protein [Gemmatimonadota bacterium]